MTYKVQYKLWIDVGNFGPPSPGLNYVRVLDNVGENRQDCKLFVESMGKQFPPHAFPQQQDPDITLYAIRPSHL